MAYNIPGGDALGSEDSPSLIKTVIVACVAAFVLLGGAFFLLATLDPSKPDNAAKPEAALGSSFGEGFMKSFVPAFREGCVKSAQAAMTKNGADVSAAGVDAKIQAYCTCAIDHTATDLTITQLMAFKMNPASEPAATKMKDIVRDCEAQIGEAGR